MQVFNYSGEFEQYILCKKCEQKLALLDGWGAIFLTHKTTGVLLKVEKKGFRECHAKFIGLDYTRYKLFILSLFVRASISQRPDLNFKLSTEIEEKISDMIINNNAGSPNEFPISKFLLRRPTGINRDRLYYPITVKKNVHAFFFSDKLNDGIVYTLHTDCEEVEYYAKDNLLQIDGSMNAIVVDDFAAGQFYLGFLKTDNKEYFSDLPNINFVGIGLKPEEGQLEKMMESGGTFFDRIFIIREHLPNQRVS